MEIAYTATATPLGEALARDLEETRKKEQQLQSASVGDRITISEEGREKQRTQAAGENGESTPDEQGGADPGAGSPLGKGIAAGKGTGQSADDDDGPESKVEKIQRQIRQVQAKITDANNRLAAAQSRAHAGQSREPLAHAGGSESDRARADRVEAEEPQAPELGSATPPMPGAAIAKGDQEVQSIQTELAQLTNQLMILYEKLQEALKTQGESGGAAGVAAG